MIRINATYLLAQAGDLTNVGGVLFPVPPEPGQAPQDADLAETPDVQFTPAIRAKAVELGNNPVAIQNWVHNTVQYLPVIFHRNQAIPFPVYSGR